MSLFRYGEDRPAVSFAVGLTALDVSAYLLVDSVGWLALYWVIMLIPKGVLSAWNHHHQHVPTFRHVWLNRALELCYALHTGMTTNMWVLHHVLGHHQHFLDQTRDESRWQLPNGKPMGVLAYTVTVAATAYPRAYAVGQKHKAQQRTFVLFTALTWALVATLVALKPVAAVFIFVLPMICSMLYTAWVTYDHHAGLDTDNQFHASNNNLNVWFNRLTGNLGYHTAHHYRQGVHWSKLPQLHETIAQHIPAHLYRKSTFDAVLPDNVDVEVDARKAG